MMLVGRKGELIMMKTTMNNNATINNSIEFDTTNREIRTHGFVPDSGTDIMDAIFSGEFDTLIIGSSKNKGGVK